MSGKYLAARDAFAEGKLSWTEDPIAAQLVNSDYVFSESHSTPDDIRIGAVGEAIDVLNPTVLDGWCLCNSLQFVNVGDETIVGIVFFRTGPNPLLIEYHDAVDGFPMLLGRGNYPIHVEIAEPGIFRI